MLEIVKTRARIVKVIQDTPEVKLLWLKPEKPIKFRSSQFIIVDIGGVKRSYSIASTQSKDYLEIGFNLHPEGKLTPTLYSKKEGEYVDISGPYGGFILDENLEDVVFISGGTGLTPLMGMMRTVVEKKLAMKLTLIYSAKTAEDVVYRKELEGLKEAGKASINVTLTREDPKRLLELNGARQGLRYHSGRVDAQYIRECVPDLAKPTFYLCGPPGLIEAAVEALAELGVPKERIKREAW